MRNALVLSVDGSMHGFELGKDFDEQYDAICNQVGAYIQYVALGSSGLLLWVAEDGKMVNLPYNKNATKLWVKYFGNTDIIVGDAVVTGDFDGADLCRGLTPKNVMLVEGIVNANVSD